VFSLFCISKAYSNYVGENRLLLDGVMILPRCVTGRRLSCVFFTLCECTAIKIHEKVIQLWCCIALSHQRWESNRQHPERGAPQTTTEEFHHSISFTPPLLLLTRLFMWRHRLATMVSVKRQHQLEGETKCLVINTFSAMRFFARRRIIFYGGFRRDHN